MTDRCAHGVKGGEYGECHACKREALKELVQAAERKVVEAAERWRRAYHHGTASEIEGAERVMLTEVSALEDAREAAK